MSTKYEDLMNQQEIVQVKVGDKLHRGQLIGYCSSLFAVINIPSTI